MNDNLMEILNDWYDFISNNINYEEIPMLNEEYDKLQIAINKATIFDVIIKK